MSNLNHKMLYKTSQDIYNEEFVNLINGLNESIKEYYKVSKYNVKETDKFLSIFENEWKLIENSLKEINSSEEINKILVKVNQSESLIGQLQQNSLSNDKNLNLFFEDAKIIFKKMKSKRNENLSNLQRNRVSNSLRNQKVGSIDLKEAKINTNNEKIPPNIMKKLLYYLNQFRDYNEIVEKFSVKAKYNFINLQKSIFGILYDNQKNDNLLNISDYSKINEVNNFNINEVKNKYEEEVITLNKRIIELEQTLKNYKINYSEIVKIDELKKKIELELNKNNTNINYGKENDFEKMILNLIDTNKNLNFELNNLKSEIQKKNEIKYEDSEKIYNNNYDLKINNSSNMNNNNRTSIINLRKEMKNLYIENKRLRTELNDIKINKSDKKSKSGNKNENNIRDSFKNELENQKKIIMKKYEKEINSLTKHSQSLSKQLTSKNEEIINLQKEMINIITQLNGNNPETIKNLSINSKYTNNNNIDKNEILKLKEENLKLKKIINNSGDKNKIELLKIMSEENNLKSMEYQQEIINLQNIMNEKDELIKQYKNKIENMKNQNLNNMNIQINQLKNKNIKLSNELKNKNIEINNLKNGLSNDINYNHKINELNQIISNNKILIQSLNNQINDLKSSVTVKNQSELINKYKNDINELNNAFIKANSILEEKNLIIKKLQENPNINNAEYQIKMVEYENKIKQIEEENKNLANEIMKINNNQNEDDTNNKIYLLNLKISSLKEENEYYKNKAEELNEQLKIITKGRLNTENTLDMMINPNQFDIDKKENKDFDNKFNSINQLKQEIINLKNANEKLQTDFNQEKIKNAELLKKNQNNNALLGNTKDNNTINDNSDLSLKLQKKEEELEGIKTFLFKIQKEYEKAKEENEAYQSKIKAFKKENESIKNQLERLTTSMPKELNALQIQLDQAKKQNKQIGNNNLNTNIFNNKISSINEKDKIKEKKNNNNKTMNELYPGDYNNLLSKLNEANKEISKLNDQNKKLLFQLEEKEVKSAYSVYKTEDMNLSNYEEEFDLRKMANGVREKNKSEDIYIDYPGIQGIKDRLKDLEFRYNNLVEQIKILIGNINFTQKIKPQITQICQLLGYSPKIIAKIISFPKEKKKILGI